MAPSPRTGCRRTPARTPRSRSRPTPGPDPRAERPGWRTASGRPTLASGSAPRRRNPPRSARGRGPAPRPAPAAAPATSPDPASPRSRPARRTRTAPCRARPDAGPSGRSAPPTTPGRPRLSPAWGQGQTMRPSPISLPGTSGISRNTSISCRTRKNQAARRTRTSQTMQRKHGLTSGAEPAPAAPGAGHTTPETPAAVALIADEHAQTSVSERGDRHCPRPAGGRDGAEAARRVAQAGRATIRRRIRLPEGAARKVSASVRRACIPGHLRGIGPEPGTWKDPDPRRRSSRGSGGPE